MEHKENGNQLKNLIWEIRSNFNYFLKNWIIIFLCSLIGGILGISYAYFKKPKYESYLSFSLEENGNAFSGALNLAAEFGLSLGMSSNGIFEGDNILTIIKSRKIIESVLLESDSNLSYNKTLIEYYLDLYPLSQSHISKYYERGIPEIDFHLGKPRSAFTYLEDSILFSTYDIISKKLINIRKPDKRLNFYTINFISVDEKFSKVFLELLITNTKRYYTEIKSKRSLNTLEILEKRVASMKGNARSSISSRAAIQDANLNPVMNNQSAQLQKAQIDISAYSGAYAELFKNLEIARYQYLKDIPLLEVIDQPNYPLKKIKPGRLKTGIIFGFISTLLSILYLTVRLSILKALMDD